MQFGPMNVVESIFPRTLGACRDYCVVVAGENSPAVKFLDTEIDTHGGDALLPAPAREILYPLLISDEPL